MKRHHGGSDGVPSLEDVKYAIEKRLFVGRLPVSIDEEELREVFGVHGSLTECRLVQQKGVAFVGYSSWAAAHRALQATDGQPCLKNCGGSPIAVSFAERTGAGRGVGAPFAKGLEHSRIFVGGLSENITDSELRQLFEPYGQVDGANLLAAKSNRRCGFVNFSLWGEALDAIENLDGQWYPGSSGEALTVVLASPKDKEDYKTRNGDSYGYGRGGDSRGGDRYGSDRYTSSGDRYGSSYPPAKRHRSEADEFESLKTAYIAAVDGNTPDEICNELHRKILAARPARTAAVGGGSLSSSTWNEGGASWSNSGYGSESYSGTVSADDRDAARLFVGGLPYECTDEELRALVEQVNFPGLSASQTEILECRVLPNRGCGYLRFSSWEAATEAIGSLNDRAVSGWQLPLRVRWATPKNSNQSSGGSPQQKDFSSEPILGAVSGALKSLMGGDPAAAVAKLASTSAPGEGKIDIATADEASISAQGLDPKRLFVGQLTRDLYDKADLAKVFEPFGTVDSLRWLTDKCVAYVQFTTFEAARDAIAALDGKAIPGVSREMGFNINFSKLR